MKKGFLLLHSMSSLEWAAAVVHWTERTNARRIIHLKGTWKSSDQPKTFTFARASELPGAEKTRPDTRLPQSGTVYEVT